MQGPAVEFPRENFRAPELFCDFWFNSGPVSIGALDHCVLLLFFWDCADPASLRGVSLVREWQERYRGYGLAVIGIHSPSYPFGKDPMSVERELRRLGVELPVALDGDGIVRAAYRNPPVPSCCLVDRQGIVRSFFPGDGECTLVERGIQSLIRESGYRGEMPDLPGTDFDEAGRTAERSHLTSRLEAGFLHSSLGNIEGVVPESTLDYRDPGIYFDGRFYAAGKWTTGRYSMLPSGEGAAVVARYEGEEVFAVLEARGDGARVEVGHDGAVLAPDNFGSDVRCGSGGKCVVVAKDPRPYSLVSNQEHGEHLLRLTFSSYGPLFYSLSFLRHVTEGVLPSPSLL